MQKVLILFFCFTATLHAMEQQSNGIFIDFAQQKHIPALTTLSNEVMDDFFKPIMLTEYSEYNPESINKFLNKVDIFFDDFFQKATSDEDHNERVLIASNNTESDKLLGLCAFVKDKDEMFIDYLIVSQQLRGKGIGKALLNKALSTYKDIVVCKLVTIARGNDATHAFYEKLGFTSNKELCTVDDSIPNTHVMYQLDMQK